MKAYLLLVIFVSGIVLSKTYDILQGLWQQKNACFKVFDHPKCNSSIPAVFTTPFNATILHEADTKVWLFTVSNQNQAEELHKCGGQLPEETKFDPSIETVVLIHGFLDGVCRSAWMREMKIQFFERGKYNVILVDWTWGNYLDNHVAAFNAIAVGQQVGFVVSNIMKQMKVDGSKFHFIGHSFGAFAVSFAAKYVKKLKRKNKIKRVTALDPAILRKNAEGNIHYSDADFVDVYHTSAAKCFYSGSGSIKVLGHADFYPNGGRSSMSCKGHNKENFIKGDILVGALSLTDSACSHLHVLQLFKVTINPPNGLFVGVECDNEEDFYSGACKRCCKNPDSECAVAGMDAERYFPHKRETRKKRKYFYKIADNCPFDEDYEFSIYKDC